METIRIRLTPEQKAKLQEICDRDHRSITGTIRHWIDAFSDRDPRGRELFTPKSNKDYLE